MRECECGCVRERERKVRERMRVRERVCVCVCVCARACVRVCLCVSERERERERESLRETARICAYACELIKEGAIALSESVCACAFVYLCTRKHFYTAKYLQTHSIESISHSCESYLIQVSRVSSMRVMSYFSCA